LQLTLIKEGDLHLLQQKDIMMSKMQDEQEGVFYNLYFTNLKNTPAGGASGYLIQQGTRIFFVSLNPLTNEEKKEICNFVRENFLKEDTPLLNLYICNAGLYVIGQSVGVEEPIVMGLDLHQQSEIHQ